MPDSTGLYYPWIHFKDDAWVKLSMLYWKRLQRIVPPFYDKRDSATVIEFADSEMIVDVDPSRSAARIAPAFAAVIRRNDDALRANYGISDGANRWVAPEAVGFHQIPSSGVAGSDPYAYIHVTKIARDLRLQLTESGLGVATRGGDPDWVGVHPAVARIYMTALAEDIAQRTQVNPVSEQELDLVAVGGWSVDRLTTALLPTGGPSDEEEGDSSPAATLAFVALRTVIPKDFSAVPVKKIIEVRNSYGSELRDFQAAMQQLADGAHLASVTDADAMQMHIQDAYKDQIAPRLESLKHDLKLFSIDTVSSYLNVKVALPPLAASSIGDTGILESTAGEVGLAAATTGAVVLGLMNARQSLLSRSAQAMSGSPAAFMFRVEEELNAQSARLKMRKAIRRFAMGV